MVFVDSNVLVFALGGPHPLRAEAAARLRAGFGRPAGLCTSSEVLQELLHIHLRRGEPDRFDDALALVRRAGIRIWPIEPEDLTLARALADVHPRLDARGLLHLAACRRRRASDLLTFDRPLAAAWTTPARRGPGAPAGRRSGKAVRRP